MIIPLIRLPEIDVVVGLGVFFGLETGDRAMRNMLIGLTLALALAGCATPFAPPPPPVRPAVVVATPATGAVTVRVSSKLRAGPSAGTEVIGHANPGEVLTVVARSGNWIQVGNPVAGAWIYADLVE
jgi:hypothetical protein